MASIINALTSGTGGIVTAGDASGILQLQTANTAALTIDGSQNVNVGSATQIGGEKLGISFNDTTLNGLGLQVQGSASGAGYVAFRNSSGSLIGSVTRNGTANTVKFNTSSSGTTGAYLLDSGIAFPATQVASSDANTLDDYEEGTWTPTFNGFTGTSGWTFTNSVYIKVGRCVWVATQINAGSGALGSTQNSSYLSGLPFSVNGANTPAGVVTNYIENLGIGCIYQVNLIYTPTFSNSHTIFISGTYQTAS